MDRKIAELTAMRDALQLLAEHCHGDARPECPILGDLARAPREVEVPMPVGSPGAIRGSLGLSVASQEQA